MPGRATGRSATPRLSAGHVLGTHSSKTRPELTRKQKIKRKPEFVDFGPIERLARGDVIVIGDQRHRRGRAVTVIMGMPEAEQHAALFFLKQFECAGFHGFASSSLERRAVGSSDMGDRVVAARNALWRIHRHLSPVHWSVCWHVLAFEESHTLYAIRAGMRARHVTPLLKDALSEISSLRQRGAI